MSAAPNAADPTQPPGPQDPGTNRHAPLILLLHHIISYGRDLIATLQRQDTPGPLVAFSFGTYNLTLIIARISRGIAIAARLEQRLLRTGRTPPPNRANPTHPLRPRPARPPQPPRPPRPTQAEDDAALLRALPTAREIAAMIRRRSAGDVIVDICRDLGLDCSHPLWRDIRDAIFFHRGSMAKMMQVWVAKGQALIAALPDGGMTPFIPPDSAPGIHPAPVGRAVRHGPSLIPHR
jgi:hypothetical protein